MIAVKRLLGLKAAVTLLSIGVFVAGTSSALGAAADSSPVRLATGKSETEPVIEWEIKLHSSEVELLKNEVTAEMNRGYIPVGITYDNVELYILYLRNAGLEVDGWTIEWYDDREAMKAGITGMMGQGYVPKDITYLGTQLFVLYLHADSSAEGWWIEPSGVDMNSIQAAVQKFVDKEYIPTGISAYKGQYLTLFLDVPTTSLKSWRIQRYEVGKHGEAINDNIRQGFVPWAIEYRSQYIDILYLGF